MEQLLYFALKPEVKSVQNDNKHVWRDISSPKQESLSMNSVPIQFPFPKTECWHP